MFKRHSSARIAVLTLVMIILCSTIASAATGKINASSVKFRRHASTGSEIIDLLGKGTVLSIVSTTGDWFKVKIGNVNGYVYSDYVTIIKELPAKDAKTVVKTVITSPAVAAATTSAAVAALSLTAAGDLTADPGKADVLTATNATMAGLNATAAGLSLQPGAAGGNPASGADAGNVPAPSPSIVADAEKPAEKMLLVTANTLNIRGKANAEARKLGAVHRGDLVAMLGKNGSWTKIKASDGTVGYVLGKYLAATAVESDSDESVKTVSRGSDSSESTLDELIRVAMSFKGVRYVYGGASRKGTDCSGFVMQAYASIGISTPRSAISYAGSGVKIARENLKIGDVVLFDTDGGRRTNVSHVGIYLGNDKFIHASSTNHKVVVASLSGYQAKYLGARRFLR
jgi:cell wall-associated NlpC family hydrolase